MNNMTRIERKELEQLSKEVFGSTSRYKQILDGGSVEPVTMIKTEEVPSEDPTQPSTTKEVAIPVLAPNGVKRTYVKYYSVDEVKGLMIKLKAQKDEFMALMAQNKQEEADKKAQAELQRQVSQELSGTAVK